MELREYQTAAIQHLRQALSCGRSRLLLQASCGAGKTIISAELASLARSKNKKVLFLVNRRDIVKQTLEKYLAYGLGDQTGIIMAGVEPHLTRPIQIASVQTYGRRVCLPGDYNPWVQDADLVIVDECHTSTAPTFKAVLDMYSKKTIIGLSATPCRSTGLGLGNVYEEIISAVPMGQLIADGHLVPAVHYAPSAPDLKSIRIVAGDYDKRELGEAVDKPKLVGDIFDNWSRIAPDRSTIIFATNVKHSKHIRDTFLNRGVSAAHIDAKTDDETRAQVYSDFEAGRIRVLTNVGICCEGSDFPWVGCVVVARPTKSLARWLQMAGRGARPFPGKRDYTLLDHAGCIEEHGFVDDEVVWTLDDRNPAAKKSKPKEKKEQVIMHCEQCSRAFYGSKCPECGTPVKDYGKKVAIKEAELIRLSERESKMGPTEKKRWYAMFLFHARMKGYSDGWAYHKTLEKCGSFIRGGKDITPVQPDQACANYILGCQIRWAKRREKDAA